ncbi:MAG: nitronate monooxygenase, partial [Rhodanobacteraceae bacterium]
MANVSGGAASGHGREAGGKRPMIATRLTEIFGLRHPLVLAPMAGVAGGRLAAAVTNAGGLGLVGGGYGDLD